ncbi:MAG: hypothetical protein M9950_08240 [Thermomicrobiales bacterium]|nr:hypothetical protein [Thermomicrobiales bacterium]
MTTRRLLLLALWLALTVATSWYVARQVVNDSADATSINPVPAPSVLNREVVSLTEQMIAPVVSANAMVLPNADGDGWILEAPAPNDALAYKLLDEPLGVKALIAGGPSGFTCEWIGLGYNGGGIMTGDASLSKTGIGLPANATNVTMQCAVPDDIRATTGMNAMMVIQTQAPVTAPSLPRTAVNGTAANGTVVVVNDDGTTEVRAVELGASDTYNIEIISGLSDGESVLLFPVQQDFANATAP